MKIKPILKSTELRENGQGISSQAWLGLVSETLISSVM